MSIKELDKQYIASTYNRFDIVAVSGKGSYVFDENEKKYIDFGSGIGTLSFGIADDVWANAVGEQAKKLQHISNLYYTGPAVHLAKALCEKTGLKKVFFSNSGAEANECAIKAARKYSQDKYGRERFKIATLQNSFHGRTLTTLSATGQEHYHELFTPLTSGFVSVPAGDISALEELIKDNTLAAVMIECVQGEGGVIALDGDYVKAVADFCDKNDVLLITDEVQTGNGRTGKFYSYMNYGITPDIVTTAKGLGGGLPIGATVLGEKAENVFSFGDHGSTFGANPVCCAGALTIVDRIDDKFLSEVKRKADYIVSSLSDVKGITEISGLGLMIGLKTENPAREVVGRCMENGLLCLTAKDKVRLLPALNIPDDLVKEAVDIIKKSL